MPPQRTTRILAGVAAIAGAYVILGELPYWSARNSLAPVLTALAIGLVALAAAIAMSQRT